MKAKDLTLNVPLYGYNRGSGLFLCEITEIGRASNKERMYFKFKKKGSQVSSIVTIDPEDEMDGRLIDIDNFTEIELLYCSFNFDVLREEAIQDLRDCIQGHIEDLQSFLKTQESITKEDLLK